MRWEYVNEAGYPSAVLNFKGGYEVKTTDGKEISEYQAAKELFVWAGNQYAAMTDQELQQGINVSKMTEKQAAGLRKHLDNISLRVSKYLGLSKRGEAGAGAGE
jgi:hypothetical protein